MDRKQSSDYNWPPLTGVVPAEGLSNWLVCPQAHIRVAREEGSKDMLIEDTVYQSRSQSEAMELVQHVSDTAM